MKTKKSSKLLSMEEAWSIVEKVLNPTIANEYKEKFSEHLPFFKALELLIRRRNFYRSLIQNPSLAAEYPQIGEEDLADRLFSAFTVSSFLIKKIATDIDTMIARFVVKCVQKEIDWHKASPAERDIIKAFSFVNTMASSGTSVCGRTGICQCRGAEPPYMSACIEDSSILPKSLRAIEEDQFKKALYLEGLVKKIHFAES